MNFDRWLIFFGWLAAGAGWTNVYLLRRRLNRAARIIRDYELDNVVQH